VTNVGCEVVEGFLSDPDRSADADAWDGVPGDEIVELRGGGAEVFGGLGDGQQT
jgi:hypothetical protein